MDDKERDATIISRLILKETQLKGDHAKDQLRRMANKSNNIEIVSTNPNETSSVAISAKSGGFEKSYNIQV